MQKLFDIASSRNFYVTLVSLFLAAFQMNGVDLNLDPNQVVDNVASQNWIALITLVFINALNPIMKLITQAQKWSWDFLNSWNFRTQVLTTIFAGITLIGISFPTTAVGELISALQAGRVDLIVVALIINVINPIYHFFTKPKNIANIALVGE